MKPFNLEEYLKNPSRKVVTREGRNARIVCTDFKTKYHSVIALIEYVQYECSISCSKEGKYCNGRESVNDLFFAPEKHEGWINILGEVNGGCYIGHSRIFNSEEKAEERGNLIVTM